MKCCVGLMLGKEGTYAECFAGGFIGVNFGIAQDLSGRLPEDVRTFDREFIPIYLAAHPDVTSRIAAGLSRGFLWTVSTWIKIGDVILSPDGSGRYRVGKVTGDYTCRPEGVLPHRRPVRWFDKSIDRADMSESLHKSTGSIGTVSDVTRYRVELEDVAAFAMERHREDFLAQNGAQTALGKEHDIFDEDGERVVQQHPSDTGPIDILAVSKDKTRLLVVERQKGRASDAVVG